MSVATTLLGLFLCILFASKLRKVLLLSFLFSLIFISLNVNFHPHYKNYKILKSNSQHEGLIIEREIPVMTICYVVKNSKYNQNL